MEVTDTDVSNLGIGGRGPRFKLAFLLRLLRSADELTVRKVAPILNPLPLGSFAFALLPLLAEAGLLTAKPEFGLSKPTFRTSETAIVASAMISAARLRERGVVVNTTK